jgi:fatty-acyl-CoA synthase
LQAEVRVLGDENPPKDEKSTTQQEPAYRLGTPLGVTNVAMLSSLQLQTLGQALDRCVTLWGDRELIVFPGRRLRAGELRGEADRFARGLLSLGVQPGEHVAVWLPNRPEYVVAEFALAKIGAAIVPINTRYGAAELEHVLRQSDSTALLLMPQLGNLDCLKTLHEICPELSQGPRGRTSHGAVPHLERAIVAGGSAPDMLSYEDVLARGDAPELHGALEAREAAVKPDDIILLQYTSGTTAFPKAVMLAHGQVLRNAWQMARRAGFGAADRVLSALPMFHVGGAVGALLGAVTMGHALYLTPDFDAGETLRIIEEEKITGYIGLESMFIALRAHTDFSKRSRATLSKGWFAGTAPALRMVAEEVGIRNICSLYGLCEASPDVTITDWRDSQEKRLHSMGRPLAGLEVKISNLATGATASRGERGEICVRGWSVMKGYYQQPEETAKAIDAEGWLRTGDLGYMDGDGYLVWTGRMSDTLRVGGENVSVLELEKLLGAHPAVQAAAVVGIPDKRLHEVLAAFVQLKPGGKASAGELIEFCEGKVASFKVPRVIRFVAEFEMTGSGKIRKYTLRDSLLAELGQAGS